MHLWECVQLEGLRKNQVWLPLLKGRGSVGKRGAKPLSKISSPSPLKERGIKGVRLINSLKY